MNEFLRCRRECFLGVKAYQNIRVSILAFEKLCTLVSSNDYFLVSSVFHMGVIRYAKPFLSSKLGTGIVSYPIKELKKYRNFSTNIHNHILEIRNTLVAHDDFEQIEPRILSVGFQLNETEFFIPTTIWVANKCLAYPSGLDDATKIKNHVAITLLGVQQKLSKDIARFRRILMEYPEQAKEAEKYTNNYGNEQISDAGTSLHVPDCINDTWLDSTEPYFTEIHNGYLYESIKFRQDFFSPESIRLPNGYEIKINPLINK